MTINLFKNYSLSYQLVFETVNQPCFLNANHPAFQKEIYESCFNMGFHDFKMIHEAFQKVSLMLDHKINFA